MKARWPGMPEVTRVSSKGQVVIPTTIRNRIGVKEGSIFAITAKKDMVILKKLEGELKARDLKTLKLLEEAWKDMEGGRYKVYSKEAFLKKMRKW